MKRETLLSLRRATKKMDFHPTSQLIHTLIDSNLQLIDQIDGGQEGRDRLAEQYDIRREVKLAVKDIHSALRSDQLAKAMFMLELLLEMLREKGPQWRRTWDWYRPRIEEEFDELV